MRGPLIFSGSANPRLAEKIAGQLDVPLGKVLIKSFPDGEVYVDVRTSVRNQNVFIIQPTCRPVNDNLMELLIMADAMWRASARSVTAVMPYMGYSRQEKRSKGREPISARLVAGLLPVAKIGRMITMNLTAPAIEGFFDIPVDDLPAGRILAEYCLSALGLAGAAVISPDAGGVDPANDFRFFIASERDLSVALKNHPKMGQTVTMGMIGDVNGVKAVIVDDIISTATTTVNAGNLADAKGATEVYACATHAVFAPGAVELLNASPIKKIIVTDTIPIQGELGSKFEVISVAPVLAEAIRCAYEGAPLSELYHYLRGTRESAPWAA